MNPVEFAYFSRPGLPLYRIHTDQDVNGSTKAQNSIPEIHPDVAATEIEQKDLDLLYCICRKPYYEGDSQNQNMVQCDGPCQKWVHPACFGENEPTIKQLVEDQ